MDTTFRLSRPRLKWPLFVLVLTALCACNETQQALAGSNGNIGASSLTFYSKTPADDEPVVAPMEIAGITCDTDGDVKGHYQFQLYGEREGQYVVEMKKIHC